MRSGWRRARAAPAMPPGRIVDYHLAPTLSLSRRARRRRARPHHAGARGRADRAGEPDLGAGRRLDRAAARAGRAGAAAGAVPGGVSRPTCCSRSSCWSSCASASNPNIWLSPLMILGTQWYILFNVIAGASAFPTDLREAAGSFHLSGWLWWRKVILPGDLPVLRHRRDHRLGRLVERRHRRRGRELGRHQADGARSRRLYRRRRPKPATSLASCSASP